MIEERSALQEMNNSQKSKVERGIHMLSNLQKHYDQADPAVQFKILSSIFPERIEIAETECRTPRLNEALRLILAADAGFKKSKKGLKVPNLTMLHQVESEGFEPSSKQGN